MAMSPAIEMLIKEKKTKVYLVKETAKFETTETGKIREHVEEIFEKNKEILDHGKKNVLIMWGENDTLMTDWWIWGENESLEEGAMIEVYLFRGTQRYESPIVTAEDGLLALAGEIDR